MKKKGFVIGGLIILAGAAGAGGWYYYKENYGDSAPVRYGICIWL